MPHTNDSFCGADMDHPLNVIDTAILRAKDSAKCERFFRVDSTGPRSVKEVVVKVAHSIANRALEPIIGVTTVEVLTQSEEFQEAWEYHVEEITNKEECKWIRAGGSITDDEKVYYCSEYLVKSQKVREQEVAAFIMGYISALIYENANWISKDLYEFSYEDAEYWAHLFLTLEDRYRYKAHLNKLKMWGLPDLSIEDRYRYREHLNSFIEWEPPRLFIGDRYETSYMTVATWGEELYGECEVSALQMFIKEHIIASYYAAYI